jgi:hypothetical protein
MHAEIGYRLAICGMAGALDVDVWITTVANFLLASAWQQIADYHPAPASFVPKNGNSSIIAWQHASIELPPMRTDWLSSVELTTILVAPCSVAFLNCVRSSCAKWSAETMRSIP